MTPASLTEASPKRLSSFVTPLSHSGFRAFFPSYFALSTQIPRRFLPSRLRETTRWNYQLPRSFRFSPA